MPMKYSGDNLTFPDNSIQSTAATGFGFKNRIINGAMMIDQRNAGASVSGNNGVYTLDRFFCYASQSSKYTVQQNAGSVTPPAGFKNYLGVTSSSAYSVTSTDYFAIAQGIEGYNIADFAWGTTNATPITISFWVRSSLTGTFGGYLSGGQIYPFSYTINAANTWEQKSVTIAGSTSGTWVTSNAAGVYVGFCLGAGSTYLGTAGSWGSTNYFGPTGQTSVVGTNGATFYITGVQLEKGSTATAYDYRPYGTELALCQRYYQIKSHVVTTTNAYSDVHFLVQMRAAPTNTVTFDAGTGATFNAFNYGAACDAVYQNTNHSQIASAVLRLSSEL